MNILYAHEHLENKGLPSIFLAGPSPRKKDDINWRPEALSVLERLGFRGDVFVPLPRSGEWHPDYDAQIEWELEHLFLATVIAFWVPRDLTRLPGFTTNVEYGLFLLSKKIVLGYPPDAEKMRYLDFVARKFGVPFFNTLEETLKAAVSMTR